MQAIVKLALYAWILLKQIGSFASRTGLVFIIPLLLGCVYYWYSVIELDYLALLDPLWAYVDEYVERLNSFISEFSSRPLFCAFGFALALDTWSQVGFSFLTLTIGWTINIVFFIVMLFVNLMGVVLAVITYQQVKSWFSSIKE